MPILAVTRIGRYYRTTVPREVHKFLSLSEKRQDGRGLRGGQLYWVPQIGKHLRAGKVILVPGRKR